MTLLFILCAILAAFIAIFFLASYVKAPPDTAFIISGGRNKRKTLIGKSGFRIPFLHRMDKLSLQLIPIDVKTSSAVPTADYINVRVDAIVNVKVGNTPEMIQVASQNFLNRNTDYIGHVAREVLEGNMREIVGKMTLKDMVSDRQKFSEMVKENAVPDLAAMGLEIIAFNVQNFIDDGKVIENLGVDNIAQISKNAQIARALAEKEVAIAQATASKEANDARVAAQAEIDKKNNDLAIQKAELKKQADVKIAEAEAAKGIQAEEQRKLHEIAVANANLARQEKAIELQEREVKITERKLEAEIKKRAEAEKYAAQQAADATQYTRQKKAEVEAFEAQKRAEMERFAAEQEAAAQIAKAAAIKAEGEAMAAAERAKGEAEAAAIREKALAEAEGLLKKAEAMAAYGEAAKNEQMYEVLKAYFAQFPAVAAAIGEGYKGVDKIVMFGDDSSKLAGNILGTTTQVSEGLSESLGIDLKALLSGMFGAKLIGGNKDGVVVNVEPNNE